MSPNKVIRDAQKLALRELKEYGLDLTVVVLRGGHPRLVLSNPCGQLSQFVVFAGTPSCRRWLAHLRRDLRHVLSGLRAAAANDDRVPGC